MSCVDELGRVELLPHCPMNIGVLPYSPAYSQDRLFDVSSSLNRDHSLQVWHEFRKSCLARGWDVHTADDRSRPVDAYLVLNPCPQKLHQLGREHFHHTVAQFYEPPDVCPQQYEHEHLRFLSSHCRTIYCCNRSLCDTYGFRQHAWYVDSYPCRQQRIAPAKDRDGVCLIATNKFNRHPESQLAFRLSLARAIAQAPDLQSHFRLYGRDWLTGAGMLRRHLPGSVYGESGVMDRSLARLERRIPWNGLLRKAYRGPVAAKSDVLSAARFNLIVENMYWDGYVTEKIFDALQFGCVPIYFGASDVENHIPAELFIDGRRFPEPLEAIRFALSLPEVQIDRRIQAGQDWLRSADFNSRFGRRTYIEMLLSDLIGIGKGRQLLPGENMVTSGSDHRSRV